MSKQSRSQELVKEAVQQLYSLNCKAKRIKAKMDNLKDTLQTYFEEKKINEMLVEVPEGDVSGEQVKRIKAMLVSKLSVQYHEDKLEEKLDEDVFAQIIDKDYIITDINYLKKLLKDAGYSPKHLQKCVQVVRRVNPNKMQQLYAIGEITKEDLKGTYTAILNKHIQVKSVK